MNNVNVATCRLLPFQYSLAFSRRLSLEASVLYIYLLSPLLYCSLLPLSTILSLSLLSTPYKPALSPHLPLVRHPQHYLAHPDFLSTSFIPPSLSIYLTGLVPNPSLSTDPCS